jgi:hypothetical protein
MTNTAETEYAELADLINKKQAEIDALGLFQWRTRTAEEIRQMAPKDFIRSKLSEAEVEALLSENERLKEAGQEALQQLDWLTASPEFGKLLRAALNGEPE